MAWPDIAAMLPTRPIAELKRRQNIRGAAQVRHWECCRHRMCRRRCNPHTRSRWNENSMSAGPRPPQTGDVAAAACASNATIRRVTDDMPRLQLQRKHARCLTTTAACSTLLAAKPDIVRGHAGSSAPDGNNPWFHLPRRPPREAARSVARTCKTIWQQQ